MPAPEIVRDLVRRFRDNLADYRSGRYNETQVRHEFLDPFFIALGWDVNNREGRAEPGRFPRRGRVIGEIYRSVMASASTNETPSDIIRAIRVTQDENPRRAP